VVVSPIVVGERVCMCCSVYVFYFFFTVLYVFERIVSIGVYMHFFHIFPSFFCKIKLIISYNSYIRFLPINRVLAAKSHFRTGKEKGQFDLESNT
jgi:hypothetical protein